MVKRRLDMASMEVLVGVALYSALITVSDAYCFDLF